MITSQSSKSSKREPQTAVSLYLSSSVWYTLYIISVSQLIETSVYFRLVWCKSSDMILSTLGLLLTQAYCAKNLPHQINCCYVSMVHWSKLLFPVPWGSEGAKFVKEMSRLLRVYADKSSLEAIAMKALMIFPSLMLVKPSKKSRAKEERAYLKSRA